MTEPDNLPNTGHFGSGALEFRAWETPFTNEAVAILEVAYSQRSSWPRKVASYAQAAALIHPPDDIDLIARVYVHSTRTIYRVGYRPVGAMRLLDEHGLTAVWERSHELGGRPGSTTFCVRNHPWTDESVISFYFGTEDGWSYMIASDWECLEVLATSAPEIHEEQRLPE